MLVYCSIFPVIFAHVGLHAYQMNLLAHVSCWCVCTYVHCHCYEVPANFRTPIDISGKHRQWYMQSCRLNQSVKIHLFVCRWKILVDSACIFLLLYLIKSNFLTTHQCRVVDATPSGVSKLAVYGCALPFFQHLMGLPLRNFWQKKIHRVMSGHRTMT